MRVGFKKQKRHASEEYRCADPQLPSAVYLPIVLPHRPFSLSQEFDTGSEPGWK